MTLKTLKIFIYLFLLIFFTYKYGVKTYFHFQEHSEATSLYQSISGDNVPWTNLGYSTLGKTIYMIDSGESEDITLIIGGDRKSVV